MFRRFVSTAPPPPPPPRRGSKSIPRRIPPSPSPSPLTRSNVTEQPGDDHFNAPLYTIKAFTIATTIVMSTATATVAGIMVYLDVHNTTEFSARMRSWVSQSMPLLTAKIYRRPTSHDSVPGDPVLLAAASSSHYGSSTPSTFDHDAAQQRLGEAFDSGGLDAWAEAAAREMEAEIEVERFSKRTTV